MNWRDLTAGQVIERDRAALITSRCRQDIVHQYNVLEAEDAKGGGPVNDQAGKEQAQDHNGLQPVPEALIHRVHVYLLKLRGADATASELRQSADFHAEQHPAGFL
jgi:hypothetical protein